MMNDDFHYGMASERIDADAVCVECGSVNPEGTLLCKTCGNNLRDQRARRTTGILAENVAEQGHRQVPLVKIGLTIIGILVIIWTALNVENLEQAMVYTQMSDQGGARAFWPGSDGKVYDRMAEELRARPISPQESRLAVDRVFSDGTYAGRYTLVSASRSTGLPIGEALVKEEGDRVRYVAFLTRQNIEIRGVAKFEENTRIASRGTAALKTDSDYFDVSGFAQQSANGGFECYGLTTLNSTDSYSALAYRIPPE